MRKGKFFLAVIFAAMLIFSACSENDAEKNTAAETSKEFQARPVMAEEYKKTEFEKNVSEVSAFEKVLTDISECTVVVKNKTYADKFTEPYICVTCHEEVLQRDKDYIVSFDCKENSTSGHFALTITMTGDYKGSVVKEYNIRPVGTSLTSFDNKVTSITLHWLPRSQSADGYEIAYSDENSSNDWHSVFSDGADTDSFLLDELPENTVYKIKMRSYKNSGEDKIFSSWSEPQKVCTKPVEVRDGATYIDDILIVNKTYALPRDFGNGLDSEAIDAFYKMQNDAAYDGCYIDIISGFRSYWVQDTVYSEFCYDRGKEAADRVSARPGHSEHQTGLAMDINSTWFTFADKAEGKWLAENCYKYGFIIRYPEGKEDITGYAYESWHIRYVGKELAEKLCKSGETLEEYLGITSKYQD